MEKKIVNENLKIRKVLRKPIILVDMDDTIVEFAIPYWKIHNKLYDDKVRFEDVNGWALDAFSKRGKAAYDLFKYPGLFRNLPMKPQAKEFMEALQEIADVYIVTDAPTGTSYQEIVSFNDINEVIEFPHSNPVADKLMWLKENLNFPKEKVIFCGCKSMVSGDVLIDDKPDTFNQFVEMGRKAVLIDMPYNRHIETKWRAKDLKEAKKMVYEILLEEEILVEEEKTINT